MNTKIKKESHWATMKNLQLSSKPLFI